MKVGVESISGTGVCVSIHFDFFIFLFDLVWLGASIFPYSNHRC